MIAITRAALLGSWRLEDAILYVTLEPRCVPPRSFRPGCRVVCAPPTQQRVPYAIR
jgi:hypothetical protein